MKMDVIQDFTKLSTRLVHGTPRCSNPTCETRFLPRLMRWNKVGYTLGQQWYCAAECFEEALGDEILALLKSRSVVTPRPTRMPLGLLLHARGVITAEQLSLSLLEQRKADRNTGETVIKLGFATEMDITSAAAAQWGYPTLRMESWQKPERVLIPYHLMDLYRMLPIHLSDSGQKLLVGFVRTQEHLVLRTIEHMTRCSVTACLITPSGLAKALQQLNRGPRLNEIVFEQKHNAAEIANVTRSYVLQSGADEVRIGICGDFLWTRLYGAKVTSDLLFRLENH